ncbi:MAG: SpoIID/LytB domain-containing protein [Cellulosilyticum sp.]|nr:SpoIID/LytB domain-containing protein [Cellulosilyticum sp.]
MFRKKLMQPNSSPIIAVIFLVIIWYLLIGKDILPHFTMQSSGSILKEEKVYYKYPCSEANLARMIGLTLGAEVQVKEVEDALWYEKYYSQLEALGIKSLTKDHAFNVLSSKKLKEVFSEITSVSVPIQDKEQLQLYEVLEYYGEVLRAKNIPINYTSLTVLATPTDEQGLSAWQVATNIGTFNFEGLVLDPLKSKTVQVACIDKDILGVMEIESENCFLEGCKIVEVTEQEASIEVAGFTINYQNSTLTAGDVGKVGSITIQNGQIINFGTDQEQKVDTLVSISDKEIVLAEAGTIAYKQIHIDDQTGKNQYKSIADLTYGLKVAYTMQSDDMISLQVVGSSTLQEIRVILSNRQGQYIQEDVSLSGNQDYDMMYEGTATTLTSGEVWKANQFEWKKGEKVIRFIPRNRQSKIKISSLEKGEELVGYKGIIEVTKEDEGYKIINEVDIEDYVAGVLPSEMPTSYGLEALKAQAIAIRTYGASCMESERFMNYGAHVDDTTASQVYNRIEPNDTVLEAVSKTAGLVLKSDGRLISNKFFATSYGYTANYGEVWAGADFPSHTPSYLVARQQYLGDKVITNMQDEKVFKDFISLTAEDLDAFDEASPWFRWQATLNHDELEELIKPAISNFIEKGSSLVSCTTPVNELGELCKMEILQRGQGGNIMTLKLAFENGDVIVETEYMIRSLFASNENQGLTITRSNETTVEQMSLLPSAFFTIEQTQSKDGTLEQLTLLGGGNGHGVGLSQDGARGMAEKGYSYKEILEHYYKDCEIVQG